MSEKIREHIPYGYKTYTGKILKDCQIDSYNRIQDRINEFIKAGLPVPEHVLNASHKHFVEISTIFEMEN